MKTKRGRFCKHVGSTGLKRFFLIFNKTASFFLLAWFELGIVRAAGFLKGFGWDLRETLSF